MIVRIYDIFDTEFTIAKYDDVDYVYGNTLYFTDGDEREISQIEGWEEIEDTFTVAFMTDYGYGEACHPLAVGVDKATAKSINRHFERETSWNDYTQTGTYVVMVSQTYCLNHEDYETERR